MRHFLGAPRIFIDKGPPGHDGGRRGLARRRLIDLPVVGEFFFDRWPGLLGNDQETNPHFRHDARGLGGDRGRIGSPSEALEGSGADFDFGLLDEFALIFGNTALQCREDQFRGFLEAKASRGHLGAVAVEFDLSGSPAHAEDHSSAREVVEH